MQQLKCGDRLLNLSEPQVMAIINATPDSFSDGGQYHRQGVLNLDAVLRQVESSIEAGAAIIDVGGESTRPGADLVGVDEELARVIPLVEAINMRFDTIVSLDTSSPEVMREGAGAGAGLINDVRALQREGAAQAAISCGLPVCLMHMKGSPANMQKSPSYVSVVDEVRQFFEVRIRQLIELGMDASNLLLDPGFGFGKKLEHNLQLLKHLSDFADFHAPILVGMSRKSMFGDLLGRPVNERLAGSLAAALVAAQNGAKIVRVHDVAETADVLKLLRALSHVD